MTDSPDPNPEASPAPDAVATPAAANAGRWRYRRLRRGHRTLLVIGAVLVVLLGGGTVAEAVYYGGVGMPGSVSLAQQTTFYYRDGTTVLARLGSNRTLVHLDDLPPGVAAAVVAAQDPGFMDDDTPWLFRLARAQVTAATNPHTSTHLGIAEQYAATTIGWSAGRVRVAALAGRYEAKYTKAQLLEFYLNAAYFGRGAYGLDAAAQVYFDEPATKLTVSEAMILGGALDGDSAQTQPDVVATDPTIYPEQARSRWEQTRQALVATPSLHAKARGLDAAGLAALAYPNTAKSWSPLADRSLLPQPTGFVVSHAISELLHGPLRGMTYSQLINAGFDIVTTIDPVAQRSVEAAANRNTPGSVLAGQPTKLADAVVVVEPGTGRVLAYFGGPDGTGADEAGWFYNRDNEPVGYGFHSPGQTFDVYTLAAGLKKGVSLKSYWDGRPEVSFPDAGRPFPVRNTSRCPTFKNECSLVDSFRAGLNTTFFGLTTKIGSSSVLKLARDAGIDDIWNDEAKRQSLSTWDGSTQLPFGDEVGVGQYAVTVLDQANAMATFAAGGQRATAHFVAKVTLDGKVMYTETIRTTSIGLNPAQVADLTFAMAAQGGQALPDGRPLAIKAGEWQVGDGPLYNSLWTVGFTGQLGIAVWVGSNDGRPAKTAAGASALSWTFSTPLFRRIAIDLSAGMPKQGFQPPGYTGDPEAGNTPSPGSGGPVGGSTPTP